jgi:hypothetical protein
VLALATALLNPIITLSVIERLPACSPAPPGDDKRAAPEGPPLLRSAIASAPDSARIIL